MTTFGYNTQAASACADTDRVIARSGSQRHRSSFNVLLLIAVGVIASACATTRETGETRPLMIQQQGSFAAGGTVTTAPGTFNPLKPLDPAGQMYRGDHVYAFYQVPVNAR